MEFEINDEESWKFFLHISRHQWEHNFKLYMQNLVYISYDPGAAISSQQPLAAHSRRGLIHVYQALLQMFYPVLILSIAIFICPLKIELEEKSIINVRGWHMFWFKLYISKQFLTT